MPTEKKQHNATAKALLETIKNLEAVNPEVARVMKAAIASQAGGMMKRAVPYANEILMDVYEIEDKGVASIALCLASVAYSVHATGMPIDMYCDMARDIAKNAVKNLKEIKLKGAK